MINRIYVLTVILFFAFSTYVPAQSYKVEKVAAKNFRGVFELKNFGIATCYFNEGNWLLEILDRNLVLKTKTVIDFKIKDETVISSYSNGVTLLMVFSNSEKKHRIIGFEYTGRIVKQFDLNENIGDILAAHNKGYFIAIQGKNKSNGKIKFFSNELNEAWTIESPLKFPSQGLFESKSVTQNHSTSQNFKNGFKYANEEALIWNYMKTKGLLEKKVLQNEITAVSTDGKVMFRHTLDPSNEWLALCTIQNNSVYLIGANGDIENREMNQFWLRKLSVTGELVEERKLADDLFKHKFCMTMNYNFFIKEIIKDQDGYILMGSDSETFPVWYVDGDFKFKKNTVVKRTGNLYLGSGLVSASLYEGCFEIFHRNYQFMTSSKKGLYELIIYFSRDDEAVKVEVASTLQKETQTVKKIQREESDQNVKVNWIDIFPSYPGEGILCYYQRKKKTIEFIKVGFE